MPPPFLLLIVLALVSTNVAAQPPEVRWTSYYNDGDANWRESCVSVIRTSASGFLIGGESNDGRYPCYYFVKADSIGIEEWSRTFNIGRRHDDLGGVAQGTDGAYFAVGSGNGSLFGSILKFDMNGDSLWSSDSSDYENCAFTQAISTIDGKIVACGDRSIHLIKVDEDGELIWRRTYDGGGTEIFLDVIQTQDGGYAAVGWVWPNYGLILKVDSDGEQEWIRSYDFLMNGGELLHCVVEVPGGGYIAGGWLYDNHYGSLVVKFDATGDTVWVKRDIENFDGEINDIVVAPGGGYVIVGSEGPAANDYRVMRLDDLGEEVWHMDREFDNDSGFHEATSILALEDGGYLIGGNRHMRWDGGQSAGLIRTEPDTVDLPFELEPLAASHDFDSVKVDSVVMSEISLRNFGRRYVFIDSVALTRDASAFAFDLDLPIRIDPTDTAFISVGFRPSADTTYSATLAFFYGDSQSVEVALTGRGFASNEVPQDGLKIRPTEFGIGSVFPNPFNSTTMIRFSTGLENGATRLATYDLQGRQIATLIDGKVAAGSHAAIWKAENVPTGIYIARLETATGEHSIKLVLTK